MRRCAWFATARPAQVALWFAALEGSERPVTWAELDERSTQVAHGLAARGVATGDRVAVGLRNSPALIESVIGTWKLGATPVPLRWDLPAWEQQRVLEVIDPTVHLGADAVDWVDGTRALGTEALPEAVAPFTHGICSSGSTGTPKVILIDRPGTWDDTIGQPFPAAWLEVPRPQVVLVPAPMYHTNGFMALYNLLAGDTLVLMEKFDAARVVDLVERHRVSTFTATPTMLQRIADLPGIDERDLSSVVWVLQGAAGIASSLVRRWLDLVGPEHFFMSYGMTEGLGLACLRGDEWLEHPGSVGRGYRETEIRIKATDGGLLPSGELGEIWLRSPSTGMYRYLGGGEGTAPSLTTDADGFSTAGDLGILDEEGYLTIVDRRVDMVVTGGANVYPAEVENALIEHPGIADVVVIGLADPEWGRRVHAIVEAADPAAPPSEADVIAFAKQHLAAYKAPKTVEVVDAIPRSEATKVSRSALVEARGG
ncbi:MAG: AMP-binding protein [Actinomycetota bacterium]|nr:AMP-binding protein [Acidimicrobiia bacterium]MDQ3293880.1 AMP-binding protein [Actinomycetota bacterium]